MRHIILVIILEACIEGQTQNVFVQTHQLGLEYLRIYFVRMPKDGFEIEMVQAIPGSRRRG